MAMTVRATAMTAEDAVESKRRRVRSSKPVIVDARLSLGRELNLVQSPCAERQLPLPPGMAIQPNPRHWPGDKTRWTFETTDDVVAIEHAGCSNSYCLFGAPGTGKTHLVRKALRDLIDYAPDRPEKKFGGLILDPKGSLVDDVCAMLEGHPRQHDLILIDGSRFQPPINVISCRIRTRELARSLVLAAQSSGVTAREPFWFIAWTNLFGAAMTLLEFFEMRELTLGRIVQSLMPDVSGRREIERIAEQAELNAASRAAVCAEFFADRTASEIESDIHHAAGEIRSFYRAKQDYIATVEAFLINAYGEFRGKRCEPFSPGPRSLGDPELRGQTLYDSVLEEGKIVVVSLPPSEPVLAKTLCTLIKCLFQQTVIGRKRRYRDLELNNWERVVFLLCDEYSEIASEVPGQPMGDGRFFALARENGCLGLLATQSIHVLENSSLREAWRSIFSNLAAKIFMGAADVETARLASELAGKHDWQIHTPTLSRSGDGFTFSIQKDLREREQIPAHLLTQMLQLGEAIIIGSLNGRVDPPRTRVLRVDN
jgi:hypothetical protein